MIGIADLSQWRTQQEIILSFHAFDGWLMTKKLSSGMARVCIFQQLALNWLHVT